MSCVHYLSNDEIIVEKLLFAEQMKIDIKVSTIFETGKNFFPTKEQFPLINAIAWTIDVECLWGFYFI